MNDEWQEIIKDPAFLDWLDEEWFTEQELNKMLNDLEKEYGGN